MVMSVNDRAKIRTFVGVRRRGLRAIAKQTKMFPKKALNATNNTKAVSATTTGIERDASSRDKRWLWKTINAWRSNDTFILLLRCCYVSAVKSSRRTAAGCLIFVIYTGIIIFGQVLDLWIQNFPLKRKCQWSMSIFNYSKHFVALSIARILHSK